MSTEDLHTLLRIANAKLVVKVIDACNSGTLLVKSENAFDLQDKGAFNNIIQIASCLDSQSSLAGNPLSLFTEKFLNAALRKSDGPIFYTDIINTLRDEFIDNNSQTPFFVSQCTGREKFVDDASLLDHLRNEIKEDRTHTDCLVQVVSEAERQPLTLLDRLRAADSKAVTPDLMSAFVGRLFDGLVNEFQAGDFAEFFENEVLQYSEFREDSVERYIISVMNREKRSDNFVAAIHSRELRKPNPVFGSAAFFDKFLGSDAYEETWYLHLNCKMERAQIKVTFTPKFISLQRIVLVVSCAPSLNNCYVFENVTQHMLADFGKFEAMGTDLSRRWWKLSWNESADQVAKQISEKLIETVHEQLKSAEARLSFE